MGPLGDEVNRRQAREGPLEDEVNRRQAREGPLEDEVNRRQARQGELRSKRRCPGVEGPLGDRSACLVWRYPVLHLNIRNIHRH